MRGASADVVNSPLWANQCGENVRACRCWSKGLESRYAAQVMIKLSWQLRQNSTTYQHLVLNIGLLEAGKWLQKRTVVDRQQHHRGPRLADAVGEWRLIWVVQSLGELLCLRFWQKEYVHHNLLHQELHSYRRANVPMLTPQHTSGLWRSPLLKGSTTARPKNLNRWY